MVYKNLNSRTAKINFLQKIMKGKAVINDIWYPSLNTREVYVTSDVVIYENLKTKEIINGSEFQKRSKNNQVITFE